MIVNRQPRITFTYAATIRFANGGGLETTKHYEYRQVRLRTGFV